MVLYGMIINIKMMIINIIKYKNDPNICTNINTKMMIINIYTHNPYFIAYMVVKQVIQQ